VAHAEDSILIDRPINVVYDFILDGMNNPKWRPAVVDIQCALGNPAGIGAVYKQGMKGPFGRRIDGDYEIVALKPNEMIEFQVITGPARPTGTYKFEASGNSTRVSFALHYEPKGLAKLLDPMINNAMRGEVATLSNLKSYLEGNQSPS
jgi:uncharacterized membrane protein